MISKKNFIKEYANKAYFFENDFESLLIAKLIYKNLKGKRILDLGCGPVHHILTMFLENAIETAAMDLNKENLDYIKNEIHNKKITTIQKSAITYLKRYLTSNKLTNCFPEGSFIEKNNERIKTLKEGNVLNLQDDFILRFDNIMQVGCFGALENEAEFEKAVCNAAKYLVPKGKILMINWNQKYSAKIPYNFNGKFSEIINKESYRKALSLADLKIIELKSIKKISIESKNDGCNFMIYAVAEK